MSETKGTSGFGTLLKRGDGGVGNGTKASRTISTSNQQIVLRAKKAGTPGNSKTCSILVSGNNTAFALSVTASNVTITSATDGSGVATTTVEDAIVQLYQNATFVENWEATIGAGNGSGILVAAASAALTGGAYGAEVFSTIAEIYDLSGPGRQLDTVEATHMESPGGYKEYIATLKDGTEVTFSVNYLPSDVTQTVLTDDLENRTRSHYQVVWSDTDATTDQFSAYVTNFEPKAPLDDRLSADVTLKVTGSITRI